MSRIWRIKKWMIVPLLTFLFNIEGSGQVYVRIQQAMDTLDIEGQLEQVTERTNIYNEYRAIHEDVYTKLRNSVIDSMRRNENQIQQLNNSVRERNIRIDSLSMTLQQTRENLEEAIETKNNLSFLGISMDKTLYNTIVWAVILILIGLLIVGFLVFRRNHSVTQNIKKDLDEIKHEFEEYRKSTRERHEQLVISHFNEIKKLKEGGRS